MARSTPATQAVTVAGAAVDLTAPNADGDAVDVGTTLVVSNAGGAGITVTVESTVSTDGLDLPDRTLAVPAGGVAVLPISRTVAARPAGGADPGKAYVNYSSVASVTRGVITS